MNPKLARQSLENLYRSYEAMPTKERHLGYARLSDEDVASLTDEDLFDLIASLKDLVRTPIPR